MANNLLPAATTLFLLLLTLATADTNSDLVLDIDGNPLEVGSEHYIQRATAGFVGGIGRSGRHGTDLSCPLYVIEYLNEVERGDPVKFIPVDKTQKEIHLSSDVQIDSGESTDCKTDGFWRASIDPYNRRPVITASGNSSDAYTTFRIEKIEGPFKAYKIVYPVPTSPPQQRYLTVFFDNLSRLRLVGLTDNSSRVDAFYFSKIKKDVVASM